MATLKYGQVARHTGEALGGITTVVCATFLVWLASSHTWLEILIIAWSIPPFYVAFTVGGILAESIYERTHNPNLKGDEGANDMDDLQVSTGMRHHMGK